MFLDKELLDRPELVALARIDFEKERFDQALIRLKQALALEGENLSEVWALLGATYARLRLWGKARQALNSFLEIHPNALNERFQLGMTYFDAGEDAQAFKIWQQILEREKMHPPALYYSALVSARQGELRGALQYCEIVLNGVEQDNLFFRRSKELAEQLGKDPRLSELAESQSPGAHKSH